MADPVPTSMVSANFQGVFGLLYTDKQGNVGWLRGPDESKQPSSNKYTRKNAIQVAGKGILAESGKVAITGWIRKQNDKDVREVKYTYSSIVNGV